MKKAIIGLAIVAVVGVAVWVAVYNWPPSMTGQATGADIAAAKALWTNLEPYQATYLSAWGDQLQAKPADPLEALTAFNELAYSVSGPGGLWRKTVPNKYFGCANDPELPICVAFSKAQADLAKWDQMQAKIGDLADEKAAWKFLKENRAALEQYLTELVPADDSLSACQATPFFQNKLAAALPK